MRYTTKELEEIRKYNYPVINDENGKLISNRFNWKDSLDKWTSGIPMRIKELKNLSKYMECSLSEKYWVDIEIEKREHSVNTAVQNWIDKRKGYND